MSICCMMSFKPSRQNPAELLQLGVEVMPSWGQCLEAALGTRGLYASLELLTQVGGFQKPTLYMFCQRFKNRQA